MGGKKGGVSSLIFDPASLNIVKKPDFECWVFKLSAYFHIYVPFD